MWSRAIIFRYQCWPGSLMHICGTRGRWVKLILWLMWSNIGSNNGSMAPSHNMIQCQPSIWSSLRLDWNGHHLADDISKYIFLAATKQLNEWYFPSVCLSVCPSHLFHYVPIIVSSWNFMELLPMTRVRSMQKVKVRGQRSRSHGSKNCRFWPKLGVSGL